MHDGTDRIPPPPPRELCPWCSTPRSGNDRYCEVDGYDFETPQDERWEAVITADRAYYDAVAQGEVPFPTGVVERCVPLDREEIHIGRPDPVHGIDPEIDLSRDTSVSRRHAVLVRHDRWFELVDENSANGTRLNDMTTLAKPGTRYKLGDGYRIYVGAFTRITIRVCRA